MYLKLDCIIIYNRKFHTIPTMNTELSVTSKTKNVSLGYKLKRKNIEYIANL